MRRDATRREAWRREAKHSKAEQNARDGSCLLLCLARREHAKAKTPSSMHGEAVRCGAPLCVEPRGAAQHSKAEQNPGESSCLLLCLAL